MQVQTRHFYLIFILLAALFSPLSAQEQAQEKAQTQEEPQQQRFDAAGVPEDWEIEVYEARHQSIEDLMSVLHAILSRPYRFSISETYNTLTLTAPEDIHDRVRALIERFDKPAKNVQLQFYLLRAERAPNGAPQDLPADLSPILADLSDVTQFQSFHLISAPSARTRSGGAVSLQGGTGSGHHVRLDSVTLESDGEVHLNNLQVEVQEDETPPNLPRGRRIAMARLNLSVELKDGETVVLGSSQLSREKGTALIVIVRASIIE
ncbi:MAG TPA: secretin N-terminal domain-containing protein [Acidobacteriota bacterium]|nr:secretin N-terminal domain-containing protein [Acidobacteriota bacterium]